MARARVRPSPVANLALFLGAMSLFWVAPHSQSNGSFIPAEDILLTCGASGNGKDADGRTWVTDQGSKFAPPAASNSLSESASSQNPSLPSTVPYMTARIFTAPATYSVAVSPGRFWLRLYFYPSNYGSHQGSDALFNVKANSYTLLHNFSTLQTANVLNQAYLVREYSINVTSDRLNITFSPKTSSSYAFINGIEVESMPNLFGGEPTLVGVSGGAPFPIGSSFVLQTMYRLNVGGQNIGPSGDSNLSRTWYDDTFYLYGANNGVTLSNDSAVQYTDIDPDYTAPQDVYRTFRSMTPDSNLNEKINLTWLLAVDAGFTYLVRLHFCEWIYTLPNQRVFNIYVNNQTAEQSFDVIGLVDTVGTAMYRDYASTLPAQSGDSNFWVSLQPDVSTKPQYYNSLLNGLELFKINDSSGNLAGPNPVAAPQVNYQGPGTNVIPSSSSSSSSSSKGKGPVIGGVAGGVAVLALVLAVCCFVRQRRGRSAGDKHPGWLPLPLYGGNSHTIGSKVSTTSGKSGTGSYASSAPSSFCRHFSFAEIQEATRNFDESRILGVGGFGKVYEGEIDGGVKVAVKRGNPLADQGIHEFQTEIEMLSKLRHRHLVSLIGYCEENCEMILVYDYMAKGPLRGHLYGNSNLSPLSWKQRLDICIGAARGLHYLHTGAAQTIIHRDVKTTNILIDENLVAKVSDFGLSKMGPTLDHTHVSTVVKGSFGYLDPEYYRRQQLTEKSDVYSFGVVLFEVLCARPAINPSLPREQVSIAEWALHYQRKGILEQIIDPYLKGKINPESLKKYGEAAEKCLAEQGVERPAMGDVLWNLEFALQLQETAIENKLVDDSTNNFVEISPDYNCSNNLETYAVDGPSTVTSTGGHSLASEDLDDVNPSAVFSQLVNPQGR